VLYKKLNSDLREKKSLTNWHNYLNLILWSIRDLSNFTGKLYRGFKNTCDLPQYPVGKTVSWEGFNSCSTNRVVAVGFSNAAGMLFEIESVSGRQIKQFSVYDTEDEVLLLPYTCFQVLEATPSANGNPAIVKLREIPVPRSFNVICWVDDIPSNNGKYILPCEKKGISVLPITSTKLALNFLRDYRWLFYLKNSQFKIVTDMVREEEELESTKVSKNYEAGILLIQKIQEEHKYGHKILVFCTDTKKALENCKAKNLDMEKVQISSYGSDLQKFLDSF